MPQGELRCLLGRFGQVHLAAARQLITSAEDKLRELDPASEQYNAIVNAATRLQNLIDSGNASQEELTNAMTTLTRAMAGIY